MSIPTDVGRCGVITTGITGGRPPVCALPHGHVGWHCADDGVEWGEPQPYEAELTVVGLTPEQEIRARAALAAHPPFGTKTRLEVIDEIAAYIRDGVRVSAEERSDDTTDLGGSE
jgi:hypothetical protein